MLYIEVELNQWMYRSIVEDRRILTINNDYFQLKKGLEKRLYELARKHCGNQAKWPISLVKLAVKCGTSVDLRQFKYQMKKIIEDDRLPDYHIGMSFDPNNKPDSDIYNTARWGSNRRIIVSFWPKNITRNANLLE